MLIYNPQAATKKIIQKYIVKGMTRELNLYTIKYLFNTKKAMEKGRIPLKANIKINRKMFADLAVNDEKAFAEIAKIAKNA